MTNHTPGPWHVGIKPGPIVYGPKGEQVADLTADLLMPEERLANAELIARAPSLLAENARLREALTLAQATIERLATQHGPFNSAQGTLDVISAALAVERAKV